MRRMKKTLPSSAQRSSIVTAERYVFEIKEFRNIEMLSHGGGGCLWKSTYSIFYIIRLSSSSTLDWWSSLFCLRSSGERVHYLSGQPTQLCRKGSRVGRAWVCVPSLIRTQLCDLAKFISLSLIFLTWKWDKNIEKHYRVVLRACALELRLPSSAHISCFDLGKFNPSVSQFSHL